MKKISDLVNLFYLKNATFFVSLAIGFIGWLSWGIWNFVVGELKLGIYAIIFAAMSVLLLFAYRKGDTNIQKMLLGGLLTFFLIDSIEVLFSSISQSLIAASIYSGIIVGFMLTIFVSHMFQQSDHFGDSYSDFIGQCCGFAIIAFIAWDIYLVATSSYGYDSLLWSLGFVPTLIMIICIETRVNEYKKIRAKNRKEGTWDEAHRAEAKKLFQI